MIDHIRLVFGEYFDEEGSILGLTDNRPRLECGVLLGVPIDNADRVAFFDEGKCQISPDEAISTDNRALHGSRVVGLDRGHASR